MIGSQWRARRHKARLACAAAAAMTAALITSAGIVQASPLDGAVGDTPGSSTTVPISPIEPAATCAVRGATSTTYWFGYSNSLEFSTIVAVGADNAITTSSSGGPDFAQPDQFRPGVTARSVAVRVPNGQTATWTITFRPEDGITPPSTASAVADSNTPLCPTGTPLDSANIRVAAAQITTATGPSLRDWTGRLTFATIEFRVQNARTVCSAGGWPLAQAVLWGYVDGFGVSGVAGDVPPYAPLPSWAIVRTDTFDLGGNRPPGADPTISFVRTWSPWRQVIDPYSETIITFIGPGGAAERTITGLSQTVPMADVISSCLFGRRVVLAPAVFLGGREGDYRFSITDVATNVHRPATKCGPNQTEDCDLPGSTTGPGGTRIIR